MLYLHDLETFIWSLILEMGFTFKYDLRGQNKTTELILFLKIHLLFHVQYFILPMNHTLKEMIRFDAVQIEKSLSIYQSHLSMTSSQNKGQRSNFRK